MRNYFIYKIELNINHSAFENYPLRVVLNAENVEIESEHFDDYQSCVNDCNQVIVNLKDYLTENSEIEIEIGWEANPVRLKDGSGSQQIPVKNWEPEEIVHIFLLEKQNPEIIIAKCLIIVRPYDEELIPYVD